MRDLEMHFSWVEDVIFFQNLPFHFAPKSSANIKFILSINLKYSKVWKSLNLDSWKFGVKATTLENQQSQTKPRKKGSKLQEPVKIRPRGSLEHLGGLSWEEIKDSKSVKEKTFQPLVNGNNFLSLIFKWEFVKSEFDNHSF